MRKANQEITDKKIIEEILATSNVCRIAMTDKDCPYILPFNYGYKEKCIYIHSAPEGKKIDLLKKNKKVCFEIEQKAEIVKHERACQWSTMYRSLVGYGEVEIITDFDQKKKGLEIIMAHYGAPDNIEFETKQIDSVVILKLAISDVTGKQSSHQEPRVRNQNNTMP
jgi:nitroimidazol reductase NimA-like FMN-containing flavoprotein (pyridoxamine 5'-phosphate oxidase superfamily)